MKLRNNITLLLTGILVIYLSGCYERNYTVKTKVYPDGSVERTYLIEKDDSAAVYQNPFPVIFDSTWKIEVKKVNDSTKTFIYSAAKFFPSYNELKGDIVKSDKIDKLNNSVTIGKHFRWFYTYFSYKEIYKEFLPYNNIPMDKFFSQKELQQIYSDTISKPLKSKIEDWWQKNIFEEYFKALAKSAQFYNSADFNLNLLNSKKDSLYNALVKSDTKAENVIAICEKVLGTNKVGRLKNEFESIEKNLNKNFESMLKLDGNYVNEVILPGIIVNTNAKAIEGNKLTWKFNTSNSNMVFIEMTAQSRMINTWTFIVTGILVLIILIGIVLSVIRKKRSLLK